MINVDQALGNILILSDLNYGKDSGSDNRLSLIIDSVCQLDEMERSALNNISCCILIGNCVYLDHPNPSENMETLDRFDKLVSVLAQHVKVCILPGPNDPSNSHLPRKPIKPGLLPRSTCTQGVVHLSSPAFFEMQNNLFLLSDGENINDLRRASRLNSNSKLAELTLECRHVSPTSPDTLCRFPILIHDVNNDRL